MKAKELPPLDVLENLLDYNPHTGEVTYRVSVSRRKAGEPAGTKNRRGYSSIRIDRKPYLLHRIVYSLYHQEVLQPDDIIDHIDRNPENNSINNLRKVTKSQNSFNKKKDNRNTSGHTGICWHKGTQRWQVKVGRKHIGKFKTLEEAIEVREKVVALNYILPPGCHWYRCSRRPGHPVPIHKVAQGGLISAGFRAILKTSKKQRQ